MKVELVSMTENPESVVTLAAKACYAKGMLRDVVWQDESGCVIRKCRDSGHLSVFEHASFTFAIEGVSRSLSHQLVRHRLASYSQKSQRYVNEAGFTYVTPGSISKDEELSANYNMLMDNIGRCYKWLIDSGVPQEDARYILPNACTTQLVMTMNARELLHFFRLRCCNRAQWEIRELANKMLELCRKVAPVLFEKAGAPCEYGECPEEEPCGKSIPKKYEPLAQILKDNPKLLANVKTALERMDKDGGK
ncbi:MAG TPA: FAD-dependent thymidylate synthase [Syntrophomonadaceae bacterium]|nr:FAD-dependent thymidylate synthase [Syntrophomonadaceae bacterium]